jgi:hypothetical protein
MTPEEREDLIAKITAKMPEMTDDELAILATDNGIPVPTALGKAMKADGSVTVPPIVDTSVITGPLGTLKNFLLKKTRDNEEVKP